MRLRRKGIAIVVVLLTMALVALIAGSLVVMGANNLIYSHSTVEGLTASMAAEAGVQHGLHRLCQNPPLTTQFTQSLPGGANYTVNVTLPGAVAPEISATVPLPGSHYYVRSVGVTPNGLERRVGYYVRRTSSLFSQAAFAAESIDMGKRAETDTWDSNVGSYPISHPTSPHEASIGTNANGSASVKFGHNAKVDPLSGNGAADVFVGPNPAPDVIDGASTDTFRSQRTLRTQKPLPAVDFTGMDPTSKGNLTTLGSFIPHSLTGTLDPGHYGDVDVSVLGATGLTLRPGGTYYFHSLTVGALGVLIVPPGAGANVTIKVQSTVQMGAGLVNNFTQNPQRLRIEAVGDVEIASGANAFGILYAPTARVTLKKGPGDPTWFGSMAAREVKLEDDAVIHYDRALSELQDGPGTVQIVSSRRY